MSKYDPLQQTLKAQATTKWRPTFREIERILGFSLPKSAYQRSEWWSNNSVGHTQSLSWLNAGWRTEKVDTDGRKVTFRKTGRPQIMERTGKRPSIFGCLKGTVRIAPGIDLTEPTNLDGSWHEGKPHE